MAAVTNISTVVVGAGHSGLAMSHYLTKRSIEHVVLERGEVGNSWRTERWDSLRLLTPNSQTRLPGMADREADPDGFMSMPEVVQLIDDYAVTIDAPVRPRTTVTSVTAADGGYAVVTDRGNWRCTSLVLASGAANLATVPALAADVPPSVAMVTSRTYRTPSQLAQGGVLVVGASATGVQLADEIHRSGRPVTLAVGEHVRMPRTYRGRDIFWWLDAAGVLDEGYDEVNDVVRARYVPSPQLIGTPERRSIDLTTLRKLGVEIVGRLGSVRDGVALFSGGLANTCRLADLKLNRLLDRFDQWAIGAEIDRLEGPHRPEPTVVSADSPLAIDLRRRGIATIVWATGYHPDYTWLQLPVLDRRGRIRHDGGVVLGAPGVYVLGGNLLRTRRSSYISGAAEDSRATAEHLDRFLASAAAGPEPSLWQTLGNEGARQFVQDRPE